MATTAYDIIKRPIITEQSMEQTEMKRYTFGGGQRPPTRWRSPRPSRRSSASKWRK